ncbi:beta-glucosidase [Halogeometricum luteum]|uniref:Beta-glucosidase n=1 Tax=Halogeometricum luteum TaxID=2950537 RepID=A0ABU2G3U6_9EURY|nr:beta-glucosidase [Halogeometricum sp. S3BR5-2]MDS0295472.1 beta-glucosidase [Halogeometricum sp. S3BR5-2]
MTDSGGRVEELVDALTREEKVSLVHGAVDPERTATGYLPGVERLDIPELKLADGPLGVRVPGQTATAFPASIALAATFDSELAGRQGVAMGREAKARGQDSILGPGLNLVRVPHCGRNFEYYSEDPVLTADFAAAAVEGIQSEDVIATPKHYVANNQETKRLRVSAEMSERTLRELYLPGFRAAVEAGAGSVMTSYNRVNGTHMSDHRRLLTDVLKDEWGFDGYVVSDWFGTNSVAGSANAGLDLEMPGITFEELKDAFQMDSDTDLFEDADGEALPGPDAKAGLFAASLAEAVESGEVPESRLDDMVTRVLRQMERVGLLDGERDDGAVDTPEHRELAETIAARATVLLENDGVLPLDADADVAVLGPGAEDAMLGGGGSSEVESAHETPTLDGIRARSEGIVEYAQGVAKIRTPSFFDRESEEEAETGDDELSLDEAVERAAAADVAVVVVRDANSEAEDRENLRLPGEQDELVEAVAEANDRTVVLVQSGGPVETPWREDVAAVAVTWYPGQADGDAVASVLYGDADAAGRLPVTFAPEGSYPANTEERFPGVDYEAEYDEGVFVGYRHFDAAEEEPTYPFGHGLSYAEFAYGSAEMADESTVDVEVENTSNRDGREVVQAYISAPAVDGVERPTRELAGYASVELSAGETAIVSVSLGELAFQRYDEDDGWTTDEGEYAVEVGRSSRDIQAETSVSR